MMRWGLVPPSRKGDVAGPRERSCSRQRPSDLGGLSHRLVQWTARYRARSRVSTFGSALRQDTATVLRAAVNVSCLELRTLERS